MYTFGGEGPSPNPNPNPNPNPTLLVPASARSTPLPIASYCTPGLFSDSLSDSTTQGVKVAGMC